jgi:hypothetical protein
VACANGDITGVALNANGLDGTIPSSVGSMTELNYMSLRYNNLKGTIPSSLASLTQLSTGLDLQGNNLKGTIPSSLASLTQLTDLTLRDNALTGLVPPLPFKQYSMVCDLDYPGCTEPKCNHFKCPLPAGSEQCGSAHCKWGYDGAGRSI